MRMYFRNMGIGIRVINGGKHASQRGNAIIGNMMGHIAVHRPDAGIVGDKFNVPGLSGSYQNGILADLGIRRDGKTAPHL